MFNIDYELERIGLTRAEYEAMLEDCTDKVHGENDDDWQEIIDRYGVDVSVDYLRKAQAPAPFGAVFVKDYFLSQLDDERVILEDRLGVKVEGSEKESEGKESGKSESVASGTDENFNNYVSAQLEKKKVQTEKVELNKWLREHARDQLIVEKMVEAIKGLPELPKVKQNKFEETDEYDIPRDYLLVISDEHFGVEYDIKDIRGRSVNTYSPQIFYDRMNKLKSNVIQIVCREGIQELNIMDLGDNIQGILRLNSQLMKLRYGIVESTIRYAEFMAEWINELSQYVDIKYHMVLDGNHSQLRICGAPKNSFPQENMEQIVQWFLIERLKDNKHIEVVENPTGNVFLNVAGYNVLGVHGEVKDMGKALEEYQHIYDTKINYLIAGHYHSNKSEQISDDCEVINVPSIIGTDDYAISIRKRSNPAAQLMVFEVGSGKCVDYRIKL